NSYGDINLGQGSVLDVYGGAHETAPGKITAGKGGTLTLAAGLPLPLNQNVQGSSGVVVEPLGFIHFGGGVLAPGQLRGYGVGLAAHSASPVMMWPRSLSHLRRAVRFCPSGQRPATMPAIPIFRLRFPPISFPRGRLLQHQPDHGGDQSAGR